MHYVNEISLTNPFKSSIYQVVNHKLLREIKSSSLSGRMWSEMASAAAEIANGHRDMTRLQRALKSDKIHARFVLEQLDSLKLGKKATTIRAAQANRIKL